MRTTLHWGWNSNNEKIYRGEKNRADWVIEPTRLWSSREDKGNISWAGKWRCARSSFLCALFHHWANRSMLIANTLYIIISKSRRLSRWQNWTQCHRIQVKTTRTTTSMTTATMMMSREVADMILTRAVPRTYCQTDSTSSISSIGKIRLRFSTKFPKTLMWWRIDTQHWNVRSSMHLMWVYTHLRLKLYQSERLELIEYIRLSTNILMTEKF